MEVPRNIFCVFVLGVILWPGVLLLDRDLVVSILGQWVCGVGEGYILNGYEVLNLQQLVEQDDIIAVGPGPAVTKLLSTCS
jgi:hypothetical protein